MPVAALCYTRLNTQCASRTRESWWCPYMSFENAGPFGQRELLVWESESLFCSYSGNQVSFSPSVLFLSHVTITLSKKFLSISQKNENKTKKRQFMPKCVIVHNDTDSYDVSCFTDMVL